MADLDLDNSGVRAWKRCGFLQGSSVVLRPKLRGRVCHRDSADQTRSGRAGSIRVQRWRQTFRVVSRCRSETTVYLGLSDRGPKHLLHTLACRFLLVLGRHVRARFRNLVLERSSYSAPGRNELRKPWLELAPKTEWNACLNLFMSGAFFRPILDPS